MHSNRHRIDYGRCCTITIGLACAFGALAASTGCSSEPGGNRSIVAQPTTLAQKQDFLKHIQNDPTMPAALKQQAAQQAQQGPAWMKPKTAGGQVSISR